MDDRSSETAASGRASLLRLPLLLVMAAAFFSLFGFQMLLSVVPLYVDDIGGGSVGAGLATAVFMFSTVATQIQMPMVLGRFGYRASLAAGVALLGIPAFFYGFTGSLEMVLVVTLLRGVGFGVITVVFVVLIVGVAPEGRRGEALGLFGVAITVPTIFCNALGLWLVENAGFGVVFVLGATIPLFGLISAAFIGPVPDGAASGGAGFFAGLARGPLLRIVLLFSTMTLTGGVVLTFLPIFRPGSGPFSATGALLVFGVSTTLSRWWAGRFSDRTASPAALLLPGLAMSAAGIAALSGGGFVLLFGALLFGAGFGLLQNSTLLLVMERVAKSEYGLGSTLWNAAFDAGTGVGAFVFGFVISALGFTVSFYLCAALLLAATVLIPLDRRLVSGRDG